MTDILGNWLSEYFGNKQALTLILLNILFCLTIYFFGGVFTPVFTAIVLAFLMQSPINYFAQYVSYKISCLCIFTLFMTVLTVGLTLIIPLLWQQCIMLAEEAPSIFLSVKKALDEYLLKEIDYLSPKVFDQMLTSVQNDISAFSKNIVQLSFTSIPSLIIVLIYLVLIPLMMFFFNLDKDKITDYFKKFLPDQKSQLSVIGSEILVQFSNYIRGKIYEILIIGISSCVTFKLLSLKYAFLLGTLVGLSVLIPYVGATLVTIPVVLVAYFQWGFDNNFTAVVITYTIIQVLDGNVLVPLLFSEAVSLHPLTIILAVLFFGSVGGIWGVFFAIPLAAVINAYINHWPKTSRL